MSETYKTIEIDLNDYTEDTLRWLILYSIKNNLTIEQAINRTLIIKLIKDVPDFKVEKVKCTRCGKEFYGDVFSQCFMCTNGFVEPEFCTQEMCDMYDNCKPTWMLVDDADNWLRPPKATYEDYILYISEYGMMHPSQRYGQILFNALEDIAPDVADAIRATDDDPFYTASDSTIVRFFNKVEELMGG